MTMKATKLAAILSRLHSAWRLPQATLALALAIAALASPARAAVGDKYGKDGEYTEIASLTKSTSEEKILVTDYWPNFNTWMEVELSFGESGTDGGGFIYPYFMGHIDFDRANGHGCVARYAMGDVYPTPDDKLYFFWQNGNVFDGNMKSSLQKPSKDAKITLRLENGLLTELDASGTQVDQTDGTNCARLPGKADGPFAIFGYSYSISMFPYRSHAMTVYSLKIYESEDGKMGDDSTLVRDFRPVTKGDQQGLYDVIEGNFFKLSAISNATVDFSGGKCEKLDEFGMKDRAQVGVILNEALPEFPADALPTKSGNVLAGFYDAAGNMYYTADGKTQQICGDEAPILHAVWVDWSYTINYDLKGGDYRAENPVGSAAADQPVIVIAPKRNGYRFTGWKVSGYDNNAKYGYSKNNVEAQVADDLIPCAADGSVYFKDLCTQNDGADTVTLTAQWEIALPPEYEKLDCLDNGSVISTAGFVQVTGFHFDVENAVALTYCINDTTYQWQNLFFSHHIENGGSRTEFGLCYPNLSSADPMSFHHGIDDRAGSIKNAGVSDKNVTNTLVLAETGSTFNGSPISFGGTPPISLADRSLPNDLLIFCSDDKAYSDGYPYNDSGSLCGPALVKIFSFKVMANNETDPEVILNLVPAKRKADDVEGFYDVVNGGFYPLRHRCALPTEIASHAVETWQEKAATESECGYKCGVCTDCLMRISQMILPTQPTRSWPYDGANHKPTISNTNDVMGKAGCTVTYSPAGEWKTVGTDYTVTYALTPGHVWSDGTTEAKTISYSIVPADGADFYVTADADGSGNGSSWASPFTFQEALNAVKGAAKDVTNTIYMKVGTYTNPSGTWTATINPCFIRILGGYTGVNLARSQTEYTVLDGENAHGLVNLTVSRGSSTGSKSILFDQIEFRNGQGAYRIKNNDRYNYWSQFNHCRFIDNFVPAGDTTTRGSAIEVVKGSGYSDGTMMSWVCVENCEFRGNKSCSDSATTIYSADKVGDSYAGIKLSHSLFVGNSSKVLPCVAQFGGSKDNNVTIESCTFAYNAAATKANRNDSNGGTTAGGGVVLDERDTNGFTWKVSNTIFFGNRCKQKEDEHEEAREYWVTNPQGNPKPTYLLYEKKEGYEYCFGNGADGDTCHYMVGDPMFVTPLPAAVEFDANYNPTWYVDSSKTATVAPSAMDVHLQSKEGRWNGSAWENDTVDSPALDAGDPKADYSLEPVSNGARINLGAYGNTAEASKSKVLVALDANGGPTDPDPAIVMVRQGEAMPTLTDGQKLSRPGYVFLGYGDKQWEARLMTGSESDICNEGTTVFAKMAYSTITLNGVTFDNGFSAFDNKSADDENIELVAANGSGWHTVSVYGDEGIGGDYGKLLGSALWNDSSDTSLATMSSVITLKGLTPGNSYLFQFFVHDGRQSTNGYPGSREVSVDGEDWYRVGRYGAGGVLDSPSSQWGSTFIYRFVATAETETVEVFHKKNSSNCPCAQFNAVQLRDITATDPHKYYNADGTSAKVYPTANGPSKLYAIWKYNIPGDFEILPYLNFDGTHFILTDYVPISNTWIETEMQAMGNRVSGSAALFGFFEKLRGEAVESVYGFNAELATSGSGSAVYGWVLGVNSNSGGRGRMWWGNNGWSYLANKCKVQFGYTGFTMSDGSTTISGEVRPDIKFDMDNCFPCHTALVIGGYNGALPSSWAGKTGYGTPVRPYSLTDGGLDVYSFKIYESDNGDPADAEQTLVHNFIPVTRTGDGKEGFYDVVAGEFLPLKTETVVTLDRNGGDNLETNYVYAIAGEKLPSPIDVPTRGGYEFLGYNDQEDGKGTMYYNADGTSNETLVYPDENGPATLYAQWEEYKYHVINPVSGPEIVVNYEWLTNAYGSGKSKAEYQQALFTTNQYGVVNWQAYILGYEADELEMAAILEESVQNTNPETVTIRLRDWEAREKRTAETGCTLKYTLLSARTPGELMTGGGAVVTNLEMTAEFLKWPDWSFEAPLRDLSDKEPVNYYRIKVHFIFGGGGEDVVVVSYDGAINTSTEGWYQDDYYGQILMRSPLFELPGDDGYVRAEYQAYSDMNPSQMNGYLYVSFFDAEKKAIPRLEKYSGSSYSTVDSLEYGENIYDRAWKLPSGAKYVQFGFYGASNLGIEAVTPPLKDLTVTYVGQKAAMVVADKAFETLKPVLFEAAVLRSMPGRGTVSDIDWDRGIPNLKAALTSGKEYKLLLLGDSVCDDMYYGLFTAILKDAFPQSNIKIVNMMKSNGGCKEYIEQVGLSNIPFDEYDGVMIAGISNYRMDTQDYIANTKKVIDAAQAAGCEVLHVSPMKSIDSRYDYAREWNGWTEDVGYYLPAKGTECPVNTEWMPTDRWTATCHPQTAREALETLCAEEGVANWDVFNVCYDWLARTGEPLGTFNRDATHSNFLGKSLNARVMVECFKSLADTYTIGR